MVGRAHAPVKLIKSYENKKMKKKTKINDMAREMEQRRWKRE